MKRRVSRTQEKKHESSGRINALPRRELQRRLAWYRKMNRAAHREDRTAVDLPSDVNLNQALSSGDNSSPSSSILR